MYYYSIILPGTSSYLELGMVPQMVGTADIILPGTRHGTTDGWYMQTSSYLELGMVPQMVGTCRH